MYRVGVDIGGTFTDFALFDARAAKMSVHKRLTTPHDPSEAVTEGIDALLKRDGVAIAEVSDVVHGTTLVTNAVIERKGAVTGMLATAGFSDILDMGFERRYDLFDLRVKYPPPLVPRRLRLEVAERVRFDGSVETPLDEAAVKAAARRFQELGVAAVAVCFLHAYANPAHEARAAQILRAAAPDLFVSASADVFPNMREFERWTTTTVNAFTQPMFDRYLERLEKGLASRGFRGRLYIMASSGGTLTADTARRFPVRALESGPGGRRADERLPWPQPRSDQPALLRHGRHHRQGRAGARRHAHQALQHGGGAGARVSPGQRALHPHPGHRHDRDRRRRRQHRRDRRPRPAARRPAQRRRRSGSRLLRPRRHQADADGRQPGARLSRCRLLPRRRHGARPGGSGGRHPRRRGQAPRARDAARGLGHPRHRQRGRGARLPHPRQRARLRLPLGQHGGVRRRRVRCTRSASPGSSRSRAWSSPWGPASCRRSAC